MLKVELLGDSLSVQKYRIMVYIHGVRDIPVAFLKRESKYHIEYDLFGQKVKVGLKTSACEPTEGDLFKLAIEKIKLFYFFGENR